MKKPSKDEETVNALDRQFEGLGMEEMTPLPKDESEFKLLETYLQDTKGSTHHLNYKVAEIFRIERNGERSRYEAAKVRYTTIFGPSSFIYDGNETR